MDYLLDTNIILIYARQSEVKEEIDKREPNPKHNNIAQNPYIAHKK
ncbi:hypothetical protein [Phaeodactylibacter sp.]|nr:hypothetical protein [Phaeodactylibacter sp.]MCI4648291.1 hypothetical protein [Phaeodactylibacter sp.]MCI5090440.1 hypothetical protein [Phaeodactylibacter sp.]